MKDIAQHRNEKLKTEKLVGDKGSANCTPVLLIVSVTLARNRKTPFHKRTGRKILGGLPDTKSIVY